MENDKAANEYAVYFFPTTTSGEKPYEEFFTDKEELDRDTFHNLGVIKNAPKKSEAEINALFDQLNLLFKEEEVTKAKIVSVLSDIIPNFKHIETGKNLDQRM